MNIYNPESISSIASHSHSGTIKLWRQRQDQWGERNIEKVQNKDQEGGFSHGLGVFPPASDTGLKQTGFGSQTILGKSLWVPPARLSCEASSLSSMVRIRFWNSCQFASLRLSTQEMSTASRTLKKTSSMEASVHQSAESRALEAILGLHVRNCTLKGSCVYWWIY